MSRLAAILGCLLALLVASPLCCCAAEGLERQQAASCCCCGEGKEKDLPDHDCPCASDEPREIPDAALPHPGPGFALAPRPAGEWLPAAAPADADSRPRWQPAVPWHAPPGERRALLVSRTL